MLAVERRKKITQIINENESVLVTELSKLFEVTEETIRRDLEKLEKLGILVRTYGGATIVESNVSEMPIDKRQIVNSAVKDAIAIEASKLVKEGETIFLDASTSVFFLTKHIKDIKNVTVITNSHKVVLELSEGDNIKVVCVGGLLRKNNMSFVGKTTENTIMENYFASKVFTSCQGVTLNHGFTDQNEQEAEVKKAMIKCSDNVVMLCDHSKLNNLTYTKLAELGQINYFITDKKLDDEWQQVFQDKDIEVIIADKNK